MGKGDIKTRRGKIVNGSYGNTRPKKKGNLKPKPIKVEKVESIEPVKAVKQTKTTKTPKTTKTAKTAKPAPKK